MLPLSLYRKYVPCFQQLLKVQFVIHDCVDKVILFNNASHLLSARHTDPADLERRVEALPEPIDTTGAVMLSRWQAG